MNRSRFNDALLSFPLGALVFLLALYLFFKNCNYTLLMIALSLSRSVELFVSNKSSILQEIVDESEEDVPKKTKRDPLDECMLYQFSQISSKLVDRFGPVETLHDFELAPNRRPKILVQTAGHVSGAVRFYRLPLLTLNNIKYNFIPIV